MSFALAALVVFAFSVIIERLDLVERTREVMERSANCLEVLREPSLDDETKERRLSQHSVRLFGLLGIIAGGSFLAILAPLAGVWLLERAGIGSVDGVLSVLARVDFLVGAAVLGVVSYLLVRRIGRA